MKQKILTIKLADNYNRDKTAIVNAEISGDGSLRISRRQLAAAECRAGMIYGSYMVCDTPVDCSYINVCNDAGQVVNSIRVVNPRF